MIPWRRKWQSTPVLLPGESHGQRSLVGYSPWGCKESDTTEQLHFTFRQVAVVVKNPLANAGDTRDLGSIPRSGGFPWKRKRQPTPVFLSGKFHGQKSLMGHGPWGSRVWWNWVTEHTQTVTRTSARLWRRVFQAEWRVGRGRWRQVLNVKKKKKKNIYSAAPHLSCGMWDLVPWPGIEPWPLHWEHGVLATRPPGKSQG